MKEKGVRRRTGSIVSTSTGKGYTLVPTARSKGRIRRDALELGGSRGLSYGAGVAAVNTL